MINILLLMLLCHVLDDFVFQIPSLSKLKQRRWWEENCPDGKYKKDYLMALGMHALSWSVMIHLPIMVLCVIPEGITALSVLINLAVHMWIDDAKANKLRLNLIEDQAAHILQVVATWIVMTIIIYCRMKAQF